jgi:ribonuclease HI
LPAPAYRRRTAPAAQTAVPGAVVVGTDGSCVGGNPGSAGWAWYVDARRWAAGGMVRETNQVAELFAILAALRHIPGHLPLHIRSDSQYAINSASVWLAGWKRNGWLTAARAPVKNGPLIKELDLSLGARRAPVTWEWVRGHSGDPLNDAADARCTAASHAIRTGQPVPTGPGWTT